MRKLRGMRKVVPLGLSALVCSCAPVREARQAVKPDVVTEAREELPETAEVPSPVEESPQPVRATDRDVSGIRFEGVAFDSRGHRLVVLDQERGPGSRFPDAQTAAASMYGLAAVNGGFFTPEGTPLGMVVSGGKTWGSWNPASSLGSGVWCEDHAGRSAIRRREALGRSGAAGMRELLQAGPMLVEGGRVVSGLDAEKTSARTLIAWDGGTRWWIGRTPPCSLADLARALAGGGPAGWEVKSALNLDGGRSADLWISGNVEGGPVSRRPVWNRPVRNFLVIVPR